MTVQELIDRLVTLNAPGLEVTDQSGGVIAGVDIEQDENGPFTVLHYGEPVE